MRLFPQNDDQLFARSSLSDCLREKSASIASTVEAFNPDELLTTPTDDLVDIVYSHNQIDPITLHRDNAVMDDPEEVSREITDYERRIVVRGMRYQLTVPFDGATGLFHFQPSTYTLSPPCAAIMNKNVIVRISGQGIDQPQLKLAFDQCLTEIEQYLAWQKSELDTYNSEIRRGARDSIEKRKDRLLRSRNIAQSLGYAMRPRLGAPQTYAAPKVQRKITPRSAAPFPSFKPEPTLDEAEYKFILEIIESMTHVIEKSPHAFASMGEEDLRWHYLVQLNGHYEGSATGETFNFQGKTDVLIQVDGKNVFIAECKIWGGEKILRAAIDQLLSYLTWRDTKAALVLFNRNKDFSAVLKTIQSTFQKHPHKKRGPTIDSETRFRYVFGNPTDQSREVFLTVLAFDVPSKAP
jgi:hypothetical protein